MTVYCKEPEQQCASHLRVEDHRTTKSGQFESVRSLRLYQRILRISGPGPAGWRSCSDLYVGNPLAPVGRAWSALNDKAAGHFRAGVRLDLQRCVSIDFDVEVGRLFLSVARVHDQVVIARRNVTEYELATFYATGLTHRRR